MPFATIANSSYLDLFGYRVTNQTTVETAYNMSPANIGAATYGMNVALVLPRANEPTFLGEDWATRQQTIAQYNSTNSLWSTFGADKQQFNSVEQQIKDLGLKVIESNDTASGNYVTSAEARTIWVQLNNATDFNKLFSSQPQFQEWTNPNRSSDNFLFWNGELSLPTEWKVQGLWFDLDHDAANPSNLVPTAPEVILPQGPQGVGNAAPQAQPPGPFAVSPQTIGEGYNFPLNGGLVQTGTIGLIEPGIGSALPSQQTASFQQLLNQYRAAISFPGNGQVYTQGANGQADGDGRSDERSLDVGTIAGVNPNSNIGLYVGSGRNGLAQSTVFTAFQSAIWDTTNSPAVISSSWNDLQAMSPNSPFYSANWQLIVDAALRNQTVVHDAFDGGSGNETGNGLTNVYANGMSPYGIVVGGTSISSLATGLTDPTLNTQYVEPALAGNLAATWRLVAGGLTSLTNAAPQAHFVETAWNQYYVQGNTISGYYSGSLNPDGGGYTTNWTTSGGVDGTQPVPSYQSAYGLHPTTSDPQAAVGRGVPDVAALSQGNLYYLLPNADMVGVAPNGGTSAAAPLWAALVSQLDFIFADQGLPQLGYMNDLLYIASAIAPASFNDITLGNNISSFVRGQGTFVNGNAYAMPTGFGYSADWGYDLTTGLGTPNALLLGRTLTAIAHEQIYFDWVPDVLDRSTAGVWTAGANETLSFQVSSGSNLNLSLTLGTTSSSFSSGPSSSYAWTSRLAEQTLQPGFDPALARLFDNQSQALVTQTNLAFGQAVQVTINSTAALATQGSLTADFGFVDFTTGQGASQSVVRVVQPVIVAETPNGANVDIAIVRIRQVGTDSLTVTFYKVDDYTGAIGKLHPGDADYATAAAARAYHLSTGGTSIAGPGYGNYGQSGIVNVNAGDLIAQTLTNRTTGNTYWAFAAANEIAGGEHVVHQWNYGLNVVGWEQTQGGGDRDYNDLVVGIDFTSTAGHGWLV